MIRGSSIEMQCDPISNQKFLVHLYLENDFPEVRCPFSSRDVELFNAYYNLYNLIMTRCDPAFEGLPLLNPLGGNTPCSNISLDRIGG